MRRTSSVLTKALVASVAAVALVAVPAAAEDSFVEEVTAPTNDPMRLAPGYSTEREVRVLNEAVDTSELHLQARNLVDDDNGCVHPETRDGDTTCGVDGGELSDWMRITVTRLGGTTDELLWTGTLAELADGAVLESAMPAKAEWRLRLTSELPREAGNDTQTDRVSYDLRWTMSSERGPDDVDIAGVEAEAGGSAGGGAPRLPGGVVIGGLPATGTTVGLLLLLTTAGLLSAGSIMIAAGRRRAVTP